MGRKSVVSKEMIVKAAVEILQQSGYEKVSIRNIAKLLACSTQPIYNCYDSMDDIDQDLCDYIYSYMLSHFMEKQSDEDAFLQMGLGYIEFAKTESKMFEFLYFSKRNKGISNDHLNRLRESAKKGQQMDNLDDRILAAIHEKASIFVHGLAAMLMQQNDLYSKAEIKQLIIEAVSSMSAGERSRYREE